jgi:hypothetical protein
LEVQAVKAKSEGTYADVDVVVQMRLRVAFNDPTDTADVLKKLKARDFYDITDEETYDYEKVVNVEWLDDDRDDEDDF